MHPMSPRAFRCTPHPLNISPNHQCKYSDFSEPCELCLRRGFLCIKTLSPDKERKIKRDDTPTTTTTATAPTSSSNALISPSRPPPIPESCETTPEEQFAILHLYQQVVESPYHHRHREILRAMKRSYSLIITEATLRHATVAYSASRQHNPSLLQRSILAFDKEIRSTSLALRKKDVTVHFSADHLTAFLLMAHVSRRSGDWDKVKQYLRFFGEIFLVMQNSGSRGKWFADETTYVEALFSARGFRRACPFNAGEAKDAFPYLDIVLEIPLADCTALIENQEGTMFKRSRWEKDLLALMVYNQDILLTFKACFLEVVRAYRTDDTTPSNVTRQCRKRLEILRTRWADSENSRILEWMKVLDSAFITAAFAPFIPLLSPDHQYAHCFNTGLDPVAQDLRCLRKLDQLPVVSDQLREQEAYFKATCGGFRRLFWIRYLRNLTLLYILEKFVLGTSEIDGVEVATKLCVIIMDSLIQFPVGYKHLPEMAQHGFSLAELVFRISSMTTDGGSTPPSLSLPPFSLQFSFVGERGLMELVGWVRRLGEMTGVNTRPEAEDMPDWDVVNDIPGICEALLVRSHYWES
jgi:hypothetical protein